MIEIRWHGRGGQGAFTAAKILGAAVILKQDQYALSFPSFGPERRGAPVQAFTKIDHKLIKNRSESKECDYIVFLDETLFHLEVLEDLKEGGKVIINSANALKYQKHPQIVAIDATALALSELKAPITNTAMLGAFLGVFDLIPVDSVKKIIGNYLPNKILPQNISVTQKAYHATREGKA